MKHLALTLLLPFAACPQTIRYVETPIPAELLREVPDPAPAVPTTTKALAAGYVARGGALVEANSKISAIGEIMSAER